MNREEQKHITDFIERSVNKGYSPALSAMDVEADAIIRALFVRNPEAAYRITMLAIAQSQELAWIKAGLGEMNGQNRKGLLARLFKGKRMARRPIGRGAA